MAMRIHAALLNGLRARLAELPAYAQYRVDGELQRAELVSSEVRENGSVHVSFYVERAEGSSSPAQEFMLCAADGTVLAEQADEVSFVEYIDRILYRFKFGVSVGETEVK